MDLLTLYGLICVSAMLTFYALEARANGYVLAFAGACLGASLYGFLAGTWPFGLVEAMWAFIAYKRWRRHRATPASLQFHH